jgi:hypothetical protein
VDVHAFNTNVAGSWVVHHPQAELEEIPDMARDRGEFQVPLRCESREEE